VTRSPRPLRQPVTSPAVPSEKRARQRALRAQKQAVIQKQRKRRTTRHRTGIFALLAVAIVGIVVLLQHPWSTNKKSASGTTTTTTAPTTSSAPSTTTSTFPVPSTVPLSTVAVAPTCAPAATTKRIVWFTKAPPDCIGKTSVWQATFETSLGNYVVEMPAASSYAAVNNFVFLAQWNYYNGTFFHRVIPGFVIQGGDPTGLGTGGPHGFPGYSFTGNFPPATCKVTVTAKCYQPGDFVMANSNSNSAVQNASTDGSQFFVVLPGGQTTLNGEPTYTLFGKVTSGMSVVEAIGKDGSSGGTPTVKVYLLRVILKQVKA
jgi:cyclophilin family peptidyl-prolyl cis-trans isomerase